jgi:predicted enzyme related to lactoylglutathione lyase
MISGTFFLLARFVWQGESVFSKLNHVALISDNYAAQTVFYKALFDLKTASSAKAEALAMAMGDGYVGMQIIPRFPGRQGGIDHFGIQVEDVDAVRARVAEKWPAIEIIQRPSTRPFAAFGIHDPAGTYFDLSQKGLKNRADVYEKPAWEQDRVFTHIALRALDPGRVAEFYADVFELVVSESDGTYRLSDGRITLVIIPWRISDFLGSGIEKPALDHLGFEVESIDAFRADLEEFSSRNPSMVPKELGRGPEGAVRRKLFERTGLGDVYLSDLDGILIAVRERKAAA